MSGGQDELPSGWARAPLGELADIIRGLTFPSSAKEPIPGPDTVLCLRTANVQRELTWDDVLNIPDSFVKSNACWLQAGDIVMSMANSLELVGKVAFAESPPRRVTFGGFLSVIRANGGHPAYLFHLLRSQTVQEAMRSTASRTVNIANLSLRGLLPLELPVAPESEQCRIVAKIEALQARASAAKEALDAIPPLLVKFRQSVLAAAFRGDLTREWREAHPDVEPAAKLLERIRAERKRRWVEANPKKAYVEPEPVDTAGLPELPGGWCWARAEELAWEITVGHVGPMKHRYVAAGVPFLRSQNVRENRFDPAGLLFVDEAFHADLPKSALTAGDLLVVRSGAPGTACVLPEDIGRANCADLVITRLLPGFAPLLAAFYVNSDFARAQVHDAQVGVAQQHFNVGSMKNMVIPLMAGVEQDLMLKILRERLESIAVLGAAIGQAESRRTSLTQSILSKAFRGELVPQEPNDEPAQVLLDRIRRERYGQGAAVAKRGRRRSSASAEQEAHPSKSVGKGAKR